MENPKNRLGGLISRFTGKREPFWKGLNLRANFLTGLVVAAPILITIYLTYAFVLYIDKLVAWMLPGTYDPTTHFPFTVPGVGVLLMVVALILLGAATANVAGRWLISFGEGVVDRMPVIRNIYGALKQIFETVLAQSSQSFKQVALVEYPREGVWALGFVTGETKGEIAKRIDPDLIPVFVPTTPNPTSGFLLYYPRSDVKILDMTVEEGAKMVISGGLVVPDHDKEIVEPVTETPPPQLEETPPGGNAKQIALKRRVLTRGVRQLLGGLGWSNKQPKD